MAQSSGETLRARYEAVRARIMALAAPLSAEDLCVQAMEDASPGKWHLGHTSWFWETFLLKPHHPGYQAYDARFNFLFNSYYEAVGARQARPERGLITRPGLEAVLAYRAHVDAAVSAWFDQADERQLEALGRVIATGLAHEEQHQELFLTDLKYLFSRSAFAEAAYPSPHAAPAPASPPALDWMAFEGGVFPFGHDGQDFAFDNEGPAHEAVLTPFALASRAVTNGEYLEFIEDGGYRQPGLWLADGWALVQQAERSAPLYWRKTDAGWREFTLHGERALDPSAPVCHIDYFEASAYAAWAGARLPEEREWEHAARHDGRDDARWMDPDGWLHPAVQGQAGMFGEVWQWTRSAYGAYPGYRAPQGAIGEYNGKFMCGQFVLKGGSALTPPEHVRASYRNFFPPAAQWQMTGLRLARDS
ncbi:ergothioneine biosynthesis protein EgtB [Alkalicaulis satelles]|uniref:Ergothioneine biosynthesis protein EgtB n=1 Tax=Alkalicaulis satelles TaxID=2609175 RepID=A0A5M6ZMS2_9PROT|nr:ergothioneine biosynthesis protein EgtB [Alkalicaulis satelles]KAA5804987.1 ergothioneine biosynthesis protein EgtB [Alkalicaulis satelles]